MSLLERGGKREKITDSYQGFKDTLKFAEQVAFGRNLDPLTSDALSKFATISFRINSVRNDFRKLSPFRMNMGIKYIVGYDKKDKPIRHTVYKSKYPDFIATHTYMAYYLHDTYLSEDENARLAAREVAAFVKDSLPAKIK